MEKDPEQGSCVGADPLPFLPQLGHLHPAHVDALLLPPGTSPLPCKASQACSEIEAKVLPAWTFWCKTGDAAAFDVQLVPITSVEQSVWALYAAVTEDCHVLDPVRIPRSLFARQVVHSKVLFSSMAQAQNSISDPGHQLMLNLLT